MIMEEKPTSDAVSTPSTGSGDEAKKVLTEFLKHYQPAAHPTEADDFKNTSDIIQMLEDLTGEVIDPEDVIKELRAAGFLQVEFEGRFYWMVRRV